jgi:threonine-phosphate decarboxylase
MPRLSEITEQTSRKVSKLRDEFIKDMNNISFAHPLNSKANFFLTKLDFDSEQLEYRLMERGILIRRCNDFFGLDDSFIRLCVRKKEDNTAFIRILSGLSRQGV